MSQKDTKNNGFGFTAVQNAQSYTH